jgi:hypothetical protein
MLYLPSIFGGIMIDLTSMANEFCAGLEIHSNDILVDTPNGLSPAFVTFVNEGFKSNVAIPLSMPDTRDINKTVNDKIKNKGNKIGGADFNPIPLNTLQSNIDNEQN